MSIQTHPGGRLFIRAFTVRELVSNPADLKQYADPHGFLLTHQEDGLQLLTENPYGREDDLALVVAIDGETIIGRLAFFGGPAHYNGEDHHVLWMSGFFMVDSYRSTGAGGMILLRALAARRGLLVCGGGPSRELMEVYKRSGFLPLGRFRRYVYFYCARVLVEKFIGKSFLSRIISALAQPMLQAYYAIRSRSETGAFDCTPVQSFDSSLDGIFSSEQRNFFPRSAAQLNWVLKHRKPIAFEIRRNKTLIGYCLLQMTKQTSGGPHNLPEMTIGTLLDYYLPPGADDSKRNLIKFCIEFFRKQNVDVFECHFIDEVMERFCARLGMIHIGGARVLFRPAPGKKFDPATAWFLPMGTSDLILHYSG